MLPRCFLDCSVGVGVFVTGLSQISSFFSTHISVIITKNSLGSNFVHREETPDTRRRSLFYVIRSYTSLTFHMTYSIITKQ